MKKRIAYAFTLMLGVAALGFGEGRVWNVTIPYQFHIDKKTLPAGEYQLEQSTGSDIATLINLKTREKVQMIRPMTIQVPGKAYFTLVPDKDGYRLKVP